MDNSEKFIWHKGKFYHYLDGHFLLYLYEGSGRPKTLVRGHESPGNWLDIDEDGNVTGRFNEKRGIDYD